MQITQIQEMGRVPVTVLKLNGVLNMGTTGQLEEQAHEAYSAGARYLLIDMSELSSISSAGLRSLLLIARQYSTGTVELNQSKPTAGDYKHAHVKLLNPNQPIEQVLKISGFDLLLEIHKDLKSAIESF